MPPPTPLSDAMFPYGPALLVDACFPQSLSETLMAVTEPSTRF